LKIKKIHDGRNPEQYSKTQMSASDPFQKLVIRTLFAWYIAASFFYICIDLNFFRWAKEDLENEKARSSETKGDSKEEGGVNKLLKKEVKSDASPFGELTQRLIQVKGGGKEGEVNKLLKKEVKSDVSPFGELTQRLIQVKGGVRSEVGNLHKKEVQSDGSTVVDSCSVLRL
jgi:hypothetical protein